MAGDWIKVEKATLHKPEVLLTAELLGMDRRTAIGLLLDYWSWLDSNLDDSRNGFVTHVSRKSVEEALHCPGFAAVLERIRWAEFDDEQCVLHVVNWERHNGNTAKSRALNQRRQSRFRNASVTQPALPEKRREEKILKPKNIVALPALPDWLPVDNWKAYVEMRKATRKPMTHRAILLAVSELEKLRASGEDIAAVLDQSVFRSWQGLFPVKEARQSEKENVAWWASEAATLAKARELGMSARGGESWQDFRGRIRERVQNDRQTA